MKTVAAAKLRRAQDAAVAGRPYAERLEAVMASLAGKVTVSASSPKLLARDRQGSGPSARSSRRPNAASQAGSTPTSSASRRKRAEELEAQGKDRPLLPSRAAKPRVLSRFYPKGIAHDRDMSAIKSPAFADASAMAEDLIGRFEAGEFDVAHLVYSKFRSVLAQEPVAQQLIPVPLAEVQRNAIGGLSTSSEIPTGGMAALEYEPDEETILASLLPRNIAVQIYRAMLENNAGFYGAQMTAMDNATRNAGDVINKLTILYNRTRQAAITTELIEIIAGAEAL